MIKEVADLFELLTAIHHTIDQNINTLSDEEWLQKPQDNFNNIASIVDHMTRVEDKFMSILSGNVKEVDTQGPFKSTSWDVASIRQQWSESLANAKFVLDQLRVEDLDQHAAKLGIGELNKRQLISYTIAHTAHHRGQLPLVRKLNS